MERGVGGRERKERVGGVGTGVGRGVGGVGTGVGWKRGVDEERKKVGVVEVSGSEAVPPRLVASW